MQSLHKNRGGSYHRKAQESVSTQTRKYVSIVRVGCPEMASTKQSGVKVPYQKGTFTTNNTSSVLLDTFYGNIIWHI